MTGILTVVTEEVEIILALYEETGVGNRFDTNRLKSQLIDYTIARIQTDRSLQEFLWVQRTKAKFPVRSLELRLKVENYVRSGLKQLLETTVDSSSRSSGETLLA